MRLCTTRYTNYSKMYYNFKLCNIINNYFLTLSGLIAAANNACIPPKDDPIEQCTLLILR